MKKDKLKNFYLKMEGRLISLSFKSYVYILLALGVFIFMLRLIVFEVSEFEYVAVLQFGRIEKVIINPGLNIKFPDPIQTTLRIDKRIRIIESVPTEMLTSDKKNLIINYYVLWKVKHPVKYLKKLRTDIKAKTRISSLTLSYVRGEIGQYLYEDVLKNKRDEINSNLFSQAKEELKIFGIELVDIALKKISFPSQNLASVYKRMKSEREQIAAKYISEGDEEARKIKAKADKEKTIILSDARKKASIIKGEGEAKAMALYNKAIGANSELYRFMRSLDAYEKIINDKTTIILSTDSELFRYLKSTN